jgi:hypothetical protein
MNSKRKFSLLIMVLALTVQLSFVVPSAQAQNANSSTPTMTGINPRGPNCLRRCRNEYRRCLVWARGNPGRRRSCALSYRKCLRQCTR